MIVKAIVVHSCSDCSNNRNTIRSRSCRFRLPSFSLQPCHATFTQQLLLVDENIRTSRTEAPHQQKMRNFPRLCHLSSSGPLNWVGIEYAYEHKTASSIILFAGGCHCSKIGHVVVLLLVNADRSNFMALSTVVLFIGCNEQANLISS